MKSIKYTAFILALLPLVSSANDAKDIFIEREYERCLIIESHGRSEQESDEPIVISALNLCGCYADVLLEYDYDELNNMTHDSPIIQKHYVKACGNEIRKNREERNKWDGENPVK